MKFWHFHFNAGWRSPPECDASFDRPDLAPNHTDKDINGKKTAPEARQPPTSPSPTLSARLHELISACFTEFDRASHDEAWGCAYSRVWRAYQEVIREAG